MIPDIDVMRMFHKGSIVDRLFYMECFQKKEKMGDVYVAFAKSPTAKDKFLYTYNLLKQNNKLPMECKLTKPKSNKLARKIRADANIMFQNEEFNNALCEYNKSVMTAKIGSEDYGLALANRSAALYHLEEYDACIQDIHRAESNKYPTYLSYKLYEREVKCLKYMGKISQAKLKFKVSKIDTFLQDYRYPTLNIFFFF